MSHLHHRHQGVRSAALRDFRRLLDAVPTPLLVIRPDAPRYTIVAATDAYLRTTMTERRGTTGILGRGLFEVFPPAPTPEGSDGARNLRASLERVVATRARDAMPMQKYDIRRPDGSWEERYWSPANIPILDGSGVVDYIIHCVEDVTLVAQLRSRAAAAERASAMAAEANAAKTRFLAAMSHELRTPLNAIGGYIDIVTMGIHGPLTPDQRTALERVRRSEQHLLGLINQVLSYAKIESGHLELDRERVTLRTIIDDVLALTAPQAGAKQLAVACGPTVFDGCEIEIFADGERVRQILLNLVMNAIKFTERYGRVRIDCEQTEEDVSVHVVDTGVGIPEAELSRIFEPFVQVGSRDASREGTGLGLPISRNLARAMGGDITVDSREGRGSVFTLTLPRRRRERRRSA